MGVGFLGRGCIGAFSGNCVVAIWGRERGGIFVIVRYFA